SANRALIVGDRAAHLSGHRRPRAFDHDRAPPNRRAAVPAAVIGRLARSPSSSRSETLGDCGETPALRSLTVTDVQDVAILDDVAFALQPPVAGFLRLCERSSRGNEIVVTHHLGADDLVDEVGVA